MSLLETLEGEERQEERLDLLLRDLWVQGREEVLKEVLEEMLEGE